MISPCSASPLALLTTLSMPASLVLAKVFGSTSHMSTSRSYASCVVLHRCAARRRRRIRDGRGARGSEVVRNRRRRMTQAAGDLTRPAALRSGQCNFLAPHERRHTVHRDDVASAACGVRRVPLPLASAHRPTPRRCFRRALTVSSGRPGCRGWPRSPRSQPPAASRCGRSSPCCSCSRR